MEVEILSAKDSKSFGKVPVKPDTTIASLRTIIHENLKAPHPDRQQLRLDPRNKGLKDKDTIESLGINDGGKLYLKDLGPQIGWSTVFLAEYAGPLIVYYLVSIRPSILYSGLNTSTTMCCTAKIALYCWSLHYAKRLLETVFVHRFSHATMPIRNLFKNCAYYWGFTAFVAYHVNHPLYTSPSTFQVYLGLALFLLCELGNFSIHLNLRNLRPPGSTIRKIPRPDNNPFTKLFNFVSCPNYTYEIGAWLSFSIMTQCLPAVLFTIAGAYQMAVWAVGKHRNYKKEFPDYPKCRKAIFPFVL